MKIIGQADHSHITGQRSRSTIPGQRRRKIPTASNVSLSTGGTNVVGLAEATARRAFACVPGANVSLGKPSAAEYSQTTKA
jgi:hypothetical protein